MGSVGICGSDLKYWQTGKCGRFTLEAPMVMGHEAAGTVVKTGPGVKNLQIGEYMFVLLLARNKFNWRENLKYLIIRIDN